jgi:hypothetical protein
MPIELRSGRIDFPSGSGLRAAERNYLVDRLPRNCWVALSGYHVRYDNEDHEVRQLRVELACGSGISEFGPSIYLTARLHLRDTSNNDPFSGWVDYLLFVDTDPRRILDPNLINAGVERWSL